MSKFMRDAVETFVMMVGCFVLAIGVLTIAQATDAHAQGKAPVEKVPAVVKDALKQGLTVDLVTLEAQARAAHDQLQLQLQLVKDAEAALTNAAPGAATDTASEAWVKAQGAALLAQTDFDNAMRALEAARKLRSEAAVGFVEERCTNDDGKDADVKRVCDALAAAKAAAANAGPRAPPVGP